jgi:transcriptional regulator with XRE-family HTH domain
VAAKKKRSAKDDPVSKDLGDLIRRHRGTRGLTQIELAAMAQMSNSQLSLVESGRNTEVRFAVQAANALGFKGIVDMVTTPPGDKVMPRLWKIWPLLSDQARRDVLQKVSDSIAAIEE